MAGPRGIPATVRYSRQPTDDQPTDDQPTDDQ
jgi:hypothetical protein